jgi:hypothetical protein
VLFATLAIMGTMRMKYDCRVPVVPPLQYGGFDQEIEILYGTMVAKVINELCFFSKFCKILLSRKSPDHG